MLRIGLTGSIAVGKSFVAHVLEELGCNVLDADRAAREVVGAGTRGLRAVVEEFGARVLNDDGTLNRARLGEIVFADEKKRLRLNSILHPLIIEAQDEALRRWEAEDPRGIAVVDAALMIESGGYKRFDKLIVVHSDAETQLQRLMARNNLTREEAERRISAQMPQSEKMRYADFLIDTTNGFEDTRRQTVEVYQQLRAVELAAEARRRRKER